MVSFYFDLGSPYAYLTAMRIGNVLREPAEWRPILLGGLYRLTGRSSWALGDYRRRQTGMAEIERRARDCGLPPIRWPDP
jgi:2-hydroxychromene-2-carboxylate isomerase